MLQKQMIQQFANPGAFQMAFIDYLKKSKAEINQDKTIAYQVLNDARPLGTQRVVDFFKGTLNPINTNIESDYTRPESEHFLIYKIRCYFASGTNNVLDASFDRISSNNPALSNSTFDVYNNGVRMLKNIPILDFPQDTTASVNDRGTITLDEPILWQGQTEFYIQLKDKSGLSYSSSCLRFDLVGIGLI